MDCLDGINQIEDNSIDLVLDCFLGIGTTAVACINLERNFIGIEIDQEYLKHPIKELNIIKIKRGKKNDKIRKKVR